MSSPRNGSSTPLFKKDQQNLLKKSFKISSSESMSQAYNARTSMSQLKLQELLQEQDVPSTCINRFDLLEERDGFFDPIYTKPPTQGDARHMSVKHDSPRSFNKLIHAWIESLPKDVRTAVLGILSNWRIVSKFTLAYFISILLCLIDKSGSWFGNHREWLPISTIINHPVHSIGAQVELTVQSICGLAIGLGWGSLALYISTATQPTRNHQGGILAGSLVIGIFLMGWFKAYFIRFYYCLMTSGFVLIFLSTNLFLSEATVVWHNCWDIAIPYLFGLLISLFVSFVYFPYLGLENMTKGLLNCMGDTKKLLLAFIEIDKDSDSEIIINLQKNLIHDMLVLSETFREFLSGAKVSLFDDEDLKAIRNHINFVISPLRAIPVPTNIYANKDQEKFSSTEQTNVDISENQSPIFSGTITPIPRPRGMGPFKLNNDMVYMSIMNDAFNEPLFKLIHQMVATIDQIEHTIKTLGNLGDKTDLIVKLDERKGQLKTKVHQMDLAYRKFAKSEYFSRDLLNEEAVINIFLFVRYSRQAAVMILKLSDAITKTVERSHGRRVHLPNYPLRRALRRLPKQCLRDQGADSVYHYFETKIDVDDAFERIYNLNTSRNKQHHKSTSTTIRAIDHHDFSFHSTKNPLRFKLWELISELNDTQAKYATKVSIVVLFLSLPSWLVVSWHWYYTYRCYWCPILVYYFISPRNSSTWANLKTRLMCWFMGCFWGWAANQAHHFKNSIVIGVFAILFCIPFSYGFLVEKHARSSFMGMLSFTIVALDIKIIASESSASVWHHTWPVSLAILISIFTSVLTNWLIWPFSAKRELYKATYSLLQHIGQSYQSVSERYLYRDQDDDPTDLTLELANIREVRMSQSVEAVKILLAKAKTEYDVTHTFKPEIFEILLNCCDTILENIIEARMSGIYVKVWEQDEDEDTTQALLSHRRDSVTTVIYILYILSNAFLSRMPVPRYLPSSISIRKEMFDMIAEQENKRFHSYNPHRLNLDDLSQRLTEVNTSEREGAAYSKTHWTEVHGMAFSRAFTSITEELENIIHLSKEILGEEDIFH